MSLCTVSCTFTFEYSDSVSEYLLQVHIDLLDGHGLISALRAHGRPKAPLRRCKMRHRNRRGDKNKEIEGTMFKIGQLILRKIIKIVATRCHILRLKCTKFDFG